MSALGVEAGLRELPYYKTILKSCLRKQIGALLEELATETGEESIIVMADRGSRSTSYLASKRATNFLEKVQKSRNLDIKNEFLSYCLSGLANEAREVRKPSTAKRKAKNVAKGGNFSKKPKLLNFECHGDGNSARTDFENWEPVRLKSEKDSNEDDALATYEDKLSEGSQSQPESVNIQLIIENNQEGENLKETINNEVDDSIRVKMEPLSDTDTMEDTSNMSIKIGPNIEQNSLAWQDQSQGCESLDMSVLTSSEQSFDMSLNLTSTPVLAGQTIGPIRFVRKFPPKERTTLSLPEKIHIIEEFEMADQGMSQRKLADKYKISKTAVGDMLKNRQLLKEQFEFNSNTKRKRFKTNSKFAQVNELVWQWYKVSRENGVQMSGPMIQEKALQVAQNLQAKNFKGSNGWLHSWKSRYNVTSFKDDTGLTPKLNYINDYSKVEGQNPSLQTSDAANIIMNLDTIRKRNLWNVNAVNMQGSVANLSSVDVLNNSQMGNNDRDNSKCEDKSGVSSETPNISEILNNARTVSSATLKASLDTSVKTEQDPSNTGDDSHLAKTYDKVVENALSEYEDIS